MTQSDDLLTKADALLARWRSGTVVPGPPADYPVLTEIVKAPTSHHTVPLPDITSDTEISVRSALARAYATAAAAETSEPIEIPVLDTHEAPAIDLPSAPAQADAMLAILDRADDLPDLPSIENTPAPTDAAVQALEERVRLRVLDAIEPYVGAFLEQPLRLRIEELAQDLVTTIARDARNDILALVRNAVRSAVANEIKERRDE